MPAKRINKDREHRITMEAIVDTYNSSEAAMGWYYYLEERLEFPFKAKCVCEKATSPLKKGEVIDVKAMARENECGYDMFVQIRWNGRKLAVPLSQLKGISVKDKTKEAIADWHYWVAIGYEF